MINAHHANFRFGAAHLRSPFETAQNRVVAGRNADPLDQALTWAAPHAMPEKTNDFGRPSGAARPRGRGLGQLRDECFTLAGSVSTLPALETELHCHGCALRRQIL